MSEQMIPVDKINDPAWNSRLAKEDVSGLAQSMDADGQINAITVEGPLPDGTYELVTGSRRLRAAKVNAWKEIRADVSDVSDTASRIIKNVTENLQRKDLTLYEQARACAKLRDEGVKGVEIAKKTGLSPQHVSNLTVMFHSLPTLVVKAWSEGQPAATYDFLQSLTKVRNDKKYKTDEAKSERMLELWQARVGLQVEFERELAGIGEEEVLEEESPTNGKGKGGKDAKDKPFKVTREHYKALTAAIKKSKVAGTPFALMALKALVDESAVIKGVYEPEEEEETADA